MGLPNGWASMQTTHLSQEPPCHPSTHAPPGAALAFTGGVSTL